MFKRPFSLKERENKVAKPSKRSFRDRTKLKVQQHMDSPPLGSTLTSPIVTLVVGQDRRLFACHQDVLCLSSFFAAALKGQFYEGVSHRIELPDEEPEVFSSVLEYLYKGDYYPRLLHDKRRNAWALEAHHAGPSTAESLPDQHRGSVESTLYHHGVDGILLKDTVIYCTAEKFGLDELKRLALRKQGLHTGVQVDVILRSARYAYDHTPDQDAKLRAHFLALIIRSRRTFKRSGTMQMEMESGGSKLFFDLFVAMCNHIDDVVDLTCAIFPHKHRKATQSLTRSTGTRRRPRPSSARRRRCAHGPRADPIAGTSTSQLQIDQQSPTQHGVTRNSAPIYHIRLPDNLQS